MYAPVGCLYTAQVALGKLTVLATFLVLAAFPAPMSFPALAAPVESLPSLARAPCPALP